MEMFDYALVTKPDQRKFEEGNFFFAIQPVVEAINLVKYGQHCGKQSLSFGWHGCRAAKDCGLILASGENAQNT